MDKGLINGFLFLDLKKAFDTVDHKILISKLKKYGIRGTALHLFQCYLSERKQICKLQNTMSDFVNLTCGVPHGSNLGPLLFLLYINDLLNCLEETQASILRTILTYLVMVNRQFFFASFFLLSFPFLSVPFSLVNSNVWQYKKISGIFMHGPMVRYIFHLC